MSRETVILDNFSEWCKVNGELSEARLHAEEVIVDYGRNLLSDALINSYNGIVSTFGELTPKQEYEVRANLAQFTKLHTGNIFSMIEILESHGGNVSPTAAFRVVKKGNELALDEEFGCINELWKSINT